MADPLELIEDETDELAAAPRQISTDGMTVIEHSLPDRIALEEHRANKEAASNGKPGFGVFLQKPPGAV